MRQIQVPREAQLLLSEFVMRTRFDLEQEQTHETQVVDALPVLPVASSHPTYTPDDFLRRRRPEDAGSDLWTIANVIQENVIKGRVRHRDAMGQVHTTRPIGSIDKTVKVNQRLWEFTDRLMQVLGK